MVDTPLLPKQEAARLASLHRLEVLDTPTEESFDALTGLLAHLTGMPIVLLGLVDRERVWFKSRHGAMPQEVEREPGLWTSAIRASGPYLIEDALSDPRTRDTPLVSGAPGMRAYAGVALQTSEGEVVGTLCCMDRVPRSLAPEQIHMLVALGNVAMHLLEGRAAVRRALELERQLQTLQGQLGEKVSHDPLTGVWHRSTIMDLLGQVQVRAMRDQKAFGVMMLDVDHFKQVTDQFGHAVGDHVLLAVTARLKDTLRGGDAIGRVGIEGFMCVLENCDIEAALHVAERCRAAVCRLPVSIDHEGPSLTMVSISVGLIMVPWNSEAQPGEIVRRADALLYQSRRDGRNRVTVGVLETGS